MPHRTEYYLESLIKDALRGKGFQKINEIIQEKNIYPPQKCNKQLLNQVDKGLKKELDKNEFSNVSLLLKCIQLYCRSDPEEGITLLLQQGLIAKMITWFERTRDFLSLIEPKQNKFLVSLVEDFFDTALIIAKSNTEGKKQLLGSFIPHLGHLATESTITCALRQEALRTLNTLLDNTAREERKRFAASEEICLLAKDLAKAILEVGDYDIQIAIVEALFRMMLKKWRNDLVHNWFEDQHIVLAFKEIKDKEFETDSRKFLNELNERFGDKRRVYSIPCKTAHADMIQLKKPADDKLEEFWIDFNFGSESVTFYLDCPESVLWESVRLLKEDISSCCLLEKGGEKILKIFMKKPAMINKKEATEIKIHFDSHFDVSTPLFKLMGKDKMMIISENVDEFSKDLPQQNASVITCYLETGKDTSSDSLSDILISQPSDQLVIAATETVVTTDAMLTREDQYTEERGKEASSDVAAVSSINTSNALKSPRLNATAMSKHSPLRQKDILIEPNVEGELDVQTGKTLSLQNDSVDVSKEARNSSKQVTEIPKNGYEFEHSSDSAAKELVSQVKQKVLVQKTSTHRNSETGSHDQSKSKKQLSSSFKAHLFSENSQETPSNGASEKSWILHSQKSVPKTADYTRKKPRVRSNLKVLPLSSPSSGSDHHTKKVGDSAVHTEQATRRMKPRSQIQNVMALPFPMASTPFSTIKQRDLEKVGVLLPFSDDTSPIDSDNRVTKKYEAALRSLENKDVRSKRKFPDMSASLDTKRLKLAAEGDPSDERSASIPFEPRKLFNLTEMDDQDPKEHHLNEIENDVFASQVPDEGIGEIGVIAAFENFTSELKKMFWSRYKRMEVITHSILKTPEQNILTLLNQIHQSRLNELEHFHKTVVHQLTNLEKRTQFLSDLEKDTMEFWTKQTDKLNNKLNSFCVHQMQRMQSMDLELSETKTFDGTKVQNVKSGKATDQEKQRSNAFDITSD